MVVSVDLENLMQILFIIAQTQKTFKFLETLKK